MPRFVPMGLVLCVALSGCDPGTWGARGHVTFGGGPRPVEALGYRIDGKNQFFRGSRPNPPLDDLGLKDQASRDFGCPTTSIATAARSNLAIYTATGCGNTDLYLRVYGWRNTSQLVGFEGTVVSLEVVRFVSLSRSDADQAVGQLFRSGMPPEEDHSPEGTTSSEPWTYEVPAMGGAQGDVRKLAPYIDRWIDLVRTGARDLHCPTNRVVVDIRSVGPRQKVPVAEGCGHRATYIPGPNGAGYDLSALVEAPPRP
jgi:hypothetical protein